MNMRRYRCLAAVVSLGLVIAACGDDDDDDDDGAGEATVVTEAPDVAETEDTEATEVTEVTDDTTDAADTTAADGGVEGMAVEAECGAENNESNIAAIEAVDELTVRFTLCSPDVAFPAKVAFSAVGIHPAEHLEATGGAPVDDPIGTGPYMLEAWDRGNQLVLSRFDDYWGEPAPSSTVVFRWSAEAAQRLVELQSANVDGIDNVGTEDFETVEGDAELQLIERDPLNIFYLGFNVDSPPFDDELVRQAVGYAIDKDRIVDNFYPRGSAAATQFLPPGLEAHDEAFEGYTYDPDRARELLTEAGYPDGLDAGPLSYRNVVRGYLPQPPQVASDIRDQLAAVGINVTLDEQESGAFIDSANAGDLGLHMLGWGADYPDATNFFDFHFGAGGTVQFGSGFSDIHEVLTEAGQLTDPAERNTLYEQANELLMQHAPMIPIAYGGSAVAFKVGVEGAHASPLSNESFAAMSIEGQDQLVWMQNAEPLGLYCADETDGESLRACEQINESLLAYEVGATDTVPSLAESFEPNDDLTVWTFSLRPGVMFHDGSELDADDVVMSYVVQWDAEHELHSGRAGDFTYWGALFGGHLNPPAE